MCKTETIRGLHVKDYHDLDLQALEETIKLDEQLTEQLMKLRDFLEEEDYERLKCNLDWLIIDTCDHRDYCVECQGDILSDIYESQTSDIIDDHYPYSEGLGVDE